MHLVSEGLEHRLQQCAVAFPDGAGRPRGPRWHQFIATDQQANAWLVLHGQLGHAAAGEPGQVCRPQPLAGGQKWITGPTFLICRADPGPVRSFLA